MREPVPDSAWRGSQGRGSPGTLGRLALCAATWWPKRLLTKQLQEPSGVARRAMWPYLCFSHILNEDTLTQ